MSLKLKEKGVQDQWIFWDLQACLLEPLKNNIPVLTTNKIDKRNVSMNDCEPTAFWKNLSSQSEPNLEQSTLDSPLHPLTERDDAPPNPKYAFIETFEHRELTSKVERKETQKLRKRNKWACTFSPLQSNIESGVAMDPLWKGGPSKQLLCKIT